MTNKILMSAAVLSLLEWAAPASAQTDKPQPKSPNAERTPAGKQDPVKKAALNCHKASEIIGTNVRNAKGEDLGKVEELVIAPATGSIEYAVISFGGFLGMGDKLFAVPFSILKTADVSADGRLEHFVVNVEKSRLEKAPGFEKSNWPDVRVPAWSAEIDKYYGPTSREDAAPPAGGRAARAIDENAKSRLCKASELIGADVHNATNEELGEIKELVLDPRRGRVNYFVLRSGGFLGMGDKLFAIPWETLKFDRQEKKDKLVLDVTKERFQNAPEFNEKDAKRMTDRVWMEGVYTHYGARPYWKSSSTGDEASGG